MTSWSSHCIHEASYPGTVDAMGVCPTAVACTHLASTCNEQRLVWGSPKHSSLLVLSLEQGSAETQRPGQHRQAQTPRHALSRMCSACQPWARPAAKLGPPPGPQTRPTSWGLEGAPRGHLARVESRGCPLGCSGRAGTRMAACEHTYQAGLGRVRG